MSEPKPISPKTPPQSGLPWLKLLVFGLVAAGVGAAYWQYRDVLSLDFLAEREAALRQFQIEHPILVYGLAFVVYVAITGFSLPGAAGMTLLYGWYFGFLEGVVLVSFASTTGATLAFLLSRYLLRDTIQNRFGDRLAAFNQALEKEGAFYLFTLRLIPAVPFWMINLLMGLTPMRVRSFWWVSQLGMLPGTFVFIYAGSAVPDLQTLADKGVGAVLSPWQLTQILVAFGLLGMFPIAVKKTMQWLRPASKDQTDPTKDSRKETYEAPTNPYHPPEEA